MEMDTKMWYYLSPWSWNEDGRSHCKGQIPEFPFSNNILNWYPAGEHGNRMGEFIKII